MDLNAPRCSRCDLDVRELETFRANDGKRREENDSLNCLSIEESLRVEQAYGYSYLRMVISRKGIKC